MEPVRKRGDRRSPPIASLREDFQRFWEFKNASVAGRFLDSRCKRTMRTKLEPMKKVAKNMFCFLEQFWNTGNEKQGYPVK